MEKSNVDKAMLDEIVRRIVDTAQPVKIILFGSGARNQMGPASDLDILVVKDVEKRREMATVIHRSLRGIEIGVDLIVVTPADLVRFKDSPAVVISQALQEGRVLYEAA